MHALTERPIMSDDNKLRLLLGRLPGEPKKRPVPSGTLNPEYDKTTKKMVPFKTLNETQVQTLIGGHKATFPVCFDVSSSDFSLSHADFLKYVPPIIKL